MVNVSWNDAQAYIAWLNRKTARHYRLLSEAEYEYAERAGTQTPYATGYGITTSQANFWIRPAVHRVTLRLGARLPLSEFFPQRFRPLRHAGERLGMGPGLLAGQLRPCAERWLTIAERRLPAPRGQGGCLQSGSELHAVRYPVLDRGAAAFRSGWFSGRDEPQLVAIGGAKIAPAVAEQPQFCYRLGS